MIPKTKNISNARNVKKALIGSQTLQKGDNQNMNAIDILFIVLEYWYIISNFLCSVCFSNPTSPPWSSSWSVRCLLSYTLSYSTFKGVTHGMSFKHTSPPLCYPSYMQVRLGTWSTPIIWETWLQVPRSGVPRVAIIWFVVVKFFGHILTNFWSSWFGQVN